tara:strand:+ start:1390 stop:2958 length:1569 start_codon:yes stop_codon:yes gene_type:complete
MGSGRIFIDELGRKFRIKSPEPIIEPPNNLRIARARKTWDVYLRMLGTVLPAFFLMYTSLFLILGISTLEPSMVLGSSLCSAPLVILIVRLHRPKLVHVILAVPDDSGAESHALSEGRSLRTPAKTKLSRFIVKDDSILDVPPSRHLWVIFATIVLAGVAIWALILTVSEDIGLILFIILAIPIWLVGFSLPVLAWWGTSNQLLGLSTRRRDAEAWLMAGMASAFPAFIFNSLIFPELVPFSEESWAFDFSLLAIGAPFCEEIFKALAVALFLPAIKGPKHGFQIGFTVGLGFALIENFQYIGASVFGGPIATSFTILVRGIGSIPGHAIWTAMAGTAIGWIATDKEFKTKMSWRARSMAISAIDMAEGLGIDTDGDGDLSGFDGSRPTLEEAIRQESSDCPEHDNTWSILGSSAEPSDINQDEHPMGVSDFSLTYVKSPKTMKSSGIQTPKRIIPAISLSIAGHSFWNGSSFLSFFAPTEWFGFDDGQGVAFMILWTVFLISSVLLFSRSLIRGINSLESR